MAKKAKRAPAGGLKTTSRPIAKRPRRPRVWATSSSLPGSPVSSPSASYGSTPPPSDDELPSPPNPRANLVGRSVNVVWPEDGAAYGALVVGYDEENDAHKVYFWVDGTTAVLSRDEAEIEQEHCGERKDLEDIVGMRVFIFKDVHEEEEAPYEAFVTRRLAGQTYEFMFSADDRLVSFNIVHAKEKWGALTTRDIAVDGKAIVKWRA